MRRGSYESYNYFSRSYQKEIDEHFEKFCNKDAVSKVSTKKIYEIPWYRKKDWSNGFGIKRNILRSFKKRNCHNGSFPWNTTAEK